MQVVRLQSLLQHKVPSRSEVHSIFSVVLKRILTFVLDHYPLVAVLIYISGLSDLRTYRSARWSFHSRPARTSCALDPSRSSTPEVCFQNEVLPRAHVPRYEFTNPPSFCSSWLTTLNRSFASSRPIDRWDVHPSRRIKERLVGRHVIR